MINHRIIEWDGLLLRKILRVLDSQWIIRITWWAPNKSTEGGSKTHSTPWGPLDDEKNFHPILRSIDGLSFYLLVFREKRRVPHAAFGRRTFEATVFTHISWLRRRWYSASQSQNRGEKEEGREIQGYFYNMAHSWLATSKFNTLTILQRQSFVSFPPPRPPSSTSAPTFHVYLIINPSILIFLISLESLLTSQGFCVFFFCFRKSRVSSGWRLRPKVSY